MRSKIVERSIVHYTNRERAKRGLPHLQGHKCLIQAARGHSRWMARTDTFNHKGDGDSLPWDRAAKAGYSWGASENIWQARSLNGKGGTWKSKFLWDSDWKLGRAAVISWMNSSGHRSNLLSPDWKHIGVGVARNKRGKVYLTQVFGGGAFGPGGFPIVRVSALGFAILLSIAIAVCS